MHLLSSPVQAESAAPIPVNGALFIIWVSWLILWTASSLLPIPYPRPSVPGYNPLPNPAVQATEDDSLLPPCDTPVKPLAIKLHRAEFLLRSALIQLLVITALVQPYHVPSGASSSVAFVYTLATFVAATSELAFPHKLVRAVTAILLPILALTMGLLDMSFSWWR